ncbi:hypothetical protein J2853_006688 [Streptosporangium lutulentum]|uniref:Uncharacterized protein n=1 Tax=Streptosporangium lutulentum TaxID=1461250 RepID=A0ABT9QL68_9ACTN|nr:hypothetical protein [Streptosporangium lutulentum]MDP9847477.1 hypothetical protein [Streptosporangium lutulentum]
MTRRSRSHLDRCDHLRPRSWPGGVDDDAGNPLPRIVRRGSGSAVTRRRARAVLPSAQGMSVGQLAKVAFTGDGQVRDVIHDFGADGFGSPYPRR